MLVEDKHFVANADASFLKCLKSSVQTGAKVKMNSSFNLSSVCSQHFVSAEKRRQISLPFWLFPTKKEKLKKKKTFLITIISF